MIADVASHSDATRQRVARVGDRAVPRAQLGQRDAGRPEPLGRQDVGPRRLGRHHGRGHVEYLTEIERLDQDRKRPLTARSVLASALLGESPPTLPVRRLVRIAALFGINENRARVALSRMAASGEVRQRRRGHLHPRRPAARARAGASRSLGPRTTAPFDGTWHLVVVTATGDAPAARRARRAALRAARLGELRDGTWLRPANLELDLDAATRRVDSRGSPRGPTPRPARSPRASSTSPAGRAAPSTSATASSSDALRGHAALADGLRARRRGAPPPAVATRSSPTSCCHAAGRAPAARALRRLRRAGIERCFATRTGPPPPRRRPSQSPGGADPRRAFVTLRARAASSMAVTASTGREGLELHHGVEHRAARGPRRSAASTGRRGRGSARRS